MGTLSVIFGSFVFVASCECFLPRRRREFRALRRRVGNIGFLVANLFLVAFFLPPASTVRLYLEAIGFPVWPVRDFGLSFVAGSEGRGFDPSAPGPVVAATESNRRGRLRPRPRSRG